MNHTIVDVPNSSSSSRLRFCCMGRMNTLPLPMMDLSIRGDCEILVDTASRHFEFGKHHSNSNPPQSLSLGNDATIISMNSLPLQSIFGTIRVFSPKPALINTSLVAEVHGTCSS